LDHRGGRNRAPDRARRFSLGGRKVSIGGEAKRNRQEPGLGQMFSADFPATRMVTNGPGYGI